MKTHPIFARSTRISFATDMTRGGSLVIPLGFMIEGVWAEARWLGLVGRTKLTPAELQRVNLDTWPDLTDPFDFLSQQFDKAWAADWGRAGDAVQDAWGRSALRVDVAEASDSLSDVSPDFKNDPEAASATLIGKLSVFIPQLAPAVATPVKPLRREMPFELVDDWLKRAA